MFDEHSHPLLAQVPLTVSPFVSLPTAPPLPYTYKTLPSTLPLSSTANPTGTAEPSDKLKFVLSSSGHAAHPDDIIASCRALQTHLEKLGVDAKRTLSEWEEDIREKELAEKRRVAPGWLDREEKILEPERKEDNHFVNVASIQESSIEQESSKVGVNANDTGTDIDRAFGAVGLH